MIEIEKEKLCSMLHRRELFYPQRGLTASGFFEYALGVMRNRVFFSFFIYLASHSPGGLFS